MQGGIRGNRSAGPVSVALTKREREAFEAEARRRGLGLSTTIRTLAVERANEIQADQQLERARRWQTERVRELAGHIESHGFEEATEAEIEALFGDVESGDGGTSTARG
jgi:hypothetical protein